MKLIRILKQIAQANYHERKKPWHLRNSHEYYLESKRLEKELCETKGYYILLKVKKIFSRFNDILLGIDRFFVKHEALELFLQFTLEVSALVIILFVLFKTL